MRPRIPTGAEIKFLAGQMPAFQAEENKKYANKLYELAYSTTSFGASHGQPAEEGYRYDVGGRRHKYGKYTHDGEIYEYGFSTSMSELSEHLPKEHRMDARKQWQGVPVDICMSVTHTNTGASTSFPIARLSTDKIEWGVTDESGETQWQELDIFSEHDQESLAVLKDTLDFLRKEEIKLDQR